MLFEQELAIFHLRPQQSKQWVQTNLEIRSHVHKGKGWHMKE